MKKQLLMTLFFALSILMSAQNNLLTDGSFERAELMVQKRNNSQIEQPGQWKILTTSGFEMEVVKGTAQEGTYSVLVKASAKNEKRFNNVLFQTLEKAEGPKMKITLYAKASDDVILRLFVMGHKKGEEGLAGTNGTDIKIYQSDKFMSYTISLGDDQGSGKVPFDLNKSFQLRIAVMGDYSTTPIQFWIDNIVAEARK